MGAMESFAPGEDRSSAVEAFDLLEARSGIDYALRTVQQSQVQFSLMADTKSNIMITVCSIVVSVSLTQLDNPMLLRPLLVLDFFATVALVAALLCVMPSNRKPPMRDGAVDCDSTAFNPLFFLHFRYMSSDELATELEQHFETSGELYRALIRDIHASGLALAESKYRYLRISYVAFLCGLLGGATLLAAELWQATA